jgi:CBS domain-containing protein
MNSNPVTIHEEAPAAEAIRALVENGLTVLPVLDMENRLKGVVTLRDVLNRRDLRVF